MILARLAQDFLQTRQLCGAEPSRGHEGQSRHARAQADDRNLAAPAQVRKDLSSVVAAHPGAEFARHQGQGRAGIGVVVSRREAHVAGRAQGAEPLRGQRKFAGQPDIADVAGHRDMVGTLRAQILDQRGQRLHVMGAVPAAPPVDVARGPFPDQLAPARLGQGADMGVGEMGDAIHFPDQAPPMRMPTASTTAPPTTICATAFRKGVSM